MLRRYSIFVVIAVSLISAGAFAQTVTVPAFSVVPLTMTSQLSSAVSNVGDRFTAVCNGPQCCGFPSGSIFTGSVVRVVRASGKRAGQVAVQFDAVTLPDGTCIRIKGALAGVEETLACQAPNSQCMVATQDYRGARNSFIAGENCTIFIGILCRGNIIIGQAINVVNICPPYGNIKAAGGQDVVVPAGTKLGVMFEEAVCLPAASCPPAASPAPTGAGPTSTATILFAGNPPFTANGALMLPFKTMMESSQTSYTLDPGTNIITFNTAQGPVTHKLESNIVNVNGQDKQITGYSGTVGNVIYVPSDVIAAGTGKAVKWNADESMLTLQ